MEALGVADEVDGGRHFGIFWCVVLLNWVVRLRESEKESRNESKNERGRERVSV